MRFRQFFLRYEDNFLAAFHYFGGATSALIIVAAVFGSIGCLAAALICLAIAIAIWLYGRGFDEDRLFELEESLRTSGSKEKTAWTRESAEKALNITRPRAPRSD